MEYISSFTYCDTIQTEITPQGPRYRIMNPLQALTPVSIPGNYSFSIACNVAGFEPMKENCVKIVFLTPEGDILYDTGEVKFLIPKEQINANGLTGMQFNLDIRNLILKETGLYSTKIYFNNNELGEYKIQVIVGEC